jgi:hypothetical protein
LWKTFYTFFLSARLGPWLIEKNTLEPDPAAGRGKEVRLTCLDLRAQTYHKLIADIPTAWNTTFGKEPNRLKGFY